MLSAGKSQCSASRQSTWPGGQHNHADTRGWRKKRTRWICPQTNHLFWSEYFLHPLKLIGCNVYRRRPAGAERGTSTPTSTTFRVDSSTCQATAPRIRRNQGLDFSHIIPQRSDGSAKCISMMCRGPYMVMDLSLFAFSECWHTAAWSLRKATVREGE